VLHNRPRKLDSVVSRFTPIETAQYLREHPPQGQIFNPFEWGDWLAFAGPEHLSCMVTSHVHLIPNEIWSAYQRIVETRSGWEVTIDGLGIRTLVIDKERQRGLLAALRSSTNWRVVHEDKLGVVVEAVPKQAPVPRAGTDIVAAF